MKHKFLSTKCSICYHRMRGREGGNCNNMLLKQAIQTTTFFLFIMIVIRLGEGGFLVQELQ